MHHFSSHLPEPLWWSHLPSMEPPPTSPPHHHHHHHSATATTLNFNLNNDENNYDDDIDAATPPPPLTQLQTEPMFEKPLTPSDVGKLNRLVIPKQHAEKHFPLGGDSVEKGLLLSFEEESGKTWRFRYSYWNSSQSYVLTKGWSRFVKEKRLEAGDIVLFLRHRTECDRFFVGWRRRPVTAHDSDAAVAAAAAAVDWTRGLYSAHPYPSHHLPYQPHCLHAEKDEKPRTAGKVNSKTLRLFGVNLECQLDDSEDASFLSSQGPPFGQPNSSSSSSCHMEINYQQDKNPNQNQLRNHRG